MPQSIELKIVRKLKLNETPCLIAGRVVEAAGIEPASEQAVEEALHA